MKPDNADELMTPAEVAKLFRVDPKTVTRWANSGQLRVVRTPGGHRRYRAAEVRAFLQAGEVAPPEEEVEDGHRVRLLGKAWWDE